jgi:predicted MPP superfamily phosphohydrolase
MKVLLTADLHSNPAWFRWLEEEAEKYDLICIAGDLLDAFSKVVLGDQAAQVKGFLYRLAGKTCVAVCSGNHDETEIVPPLLLSAEPRYAASWFEEMREVPDLITDGRTRLIRNQLIVTTIPFSCSVVSERVLIDEGKRLKAKHDVPWLLMVHDPVRTQPVISKAMPDYVHFGHYHGPGGFSRRSGNTLFMSAGQQLGAAIPNHVVLDSETGIAVWKCG